MSQDSFRKGILPAMALLWLAAGCIRPVCEAPGSCPEGEAAPDAGPDAGPDGGIDAGTDAGVDGGCTDDSQCPSGTGCDFTCESAGGDPAITYYGPTGVCRPLGSCPPGDSRSCAPIASYCDFEGRCVVGYCEKDIMHCPQDCTPVDPCGCICPSCQQR